MLNNLNSRQRDAVKHIGSPLLVLAGAGSGKTRVITCKIAYLIQKCGIKPQHITAVTFTNKAAKEMKNRVQKLLGQGENRGLRVSTFHSLGMDILRSELTRANLKTGFSIFDQHDSKALIKELMPGKMIDEDELNRIVQAISRWKNNFCLPEEALLQAGNDEQEHIAAKLYALYNTHLRAYNAVDFDDLIMLPVMLFKDHPAVQAVWQQRIRYLLVDEYQDTNSTQYQLVKLLIGVRQGLTVVGDDDQSIYCWRGAQPENLALLKEDFPQLTVIKLEQNYRSSGCILKAANTLIANNSHVFKKTLWSQLGYGDLIKVISAPSDEQEAERIVSSIVHHQFRYRCKYGEYAILYRGNHQARIFEKKLREQQIPYYLSGGMSFFSYTEVKDILAYLRLLVNQEDDNAFIRIVNVPRRELGAATIEKLARYAKQRHISLFAASFELGVEQVLNTRQVTSLRQFTDWIIRLTDEIQRRDCVEVVKEMVDVIGYAAWLQENSKSDYAAQKRVENVQDLLSWLERMQKAEENNTLSLADMVSKMLIMDIIERNNEEQNSADQVVLMTLHAVKGLEFPHVYMIGMEEELLPHRNSIEEENIEEERRLCYVGMTRAQKTLTLSYASKRRRYGEHIETAPSRFLSELPAENLEWINKKPQLKEEERIEFGRAHLDKLRTLLQ